MFDKLKKSFKRHNPLLSETAVKKKEFKDKIFQGMEVPTGKKSGMKIFDSTDNTSVSVIEIQSAQPSQIHAVTDGTSLITITAEANENYASQILGRADRIYDLARIENKKRRNSKLDEAEWQIKELWRYMNGLLVHTEMFTVLLLFRIGIILNTVEEIFEKKSDYKQWERSSFGTEHTRYFQHAKQIAEMGDFAENFAAMGKERLLKIWRMETEDNKEKCYQLLNSNPFPDIAKDSLHEDDTEKQRGKLFNLHVDSVITQKRLQDQGINIVSSDQATLISSFFGRSLKVSEAEKLSEELEKEESKEDYLNDLIMNKMIYPQEEKNVNLKKSESLWFILAKLIDYKDHENFADRDDIIKIKSKTPAELIQEARDFLDDLYSKFNGVNSDNTINSIKTEGE